ncbi:MAG: hypothetical protein CVV00_09240 [Firmicutes bacterium HGW-Firmicutes-5]|nr:MAG: hypothetical protein CVV00_09240 [Firmicutes bacterium HGW-Firmicutes-5]
MAIIKMQKVRAGKPYGLKAVLDYIQNPDKTENGTLVSAKDCLLECAYKQMHLVKQDYQQLHGRQYVHIIQSFSLSDDLTDQVAHDIGQKILNSFDGFQGVVATHTDRKHIHNHLVLSSVNFKTGLKWQQSKKDLQNLKDLSDQLCRDYGLSVIEKGKGWRSYGENKANHNGGSWKQSLAEFVADAIHVSNSREEFLHYMNNKGLEVDFRADKVIFTMPDGKKCGSDKLLSYGDFTKENLDNTIQYNQLTFMDAINNPGVMYDAIRIASEFLGRDDRSELQNKYLRGEQLSALEGDALKHAIHELKKGGCYTPNKTKSTTSDTNQSPYLLMTIASTLEAYLEEKGREEQYQQLREQFIDEEEYEL